MEEGQISCKNCGALIPYHSSRCPECGIENPIPRSEKAKNVIIIAMAVIIVVLVGAMAYGTVNALVKLF
ncbi:hypothetical protein LRR81_05120 [Metabacillus sp. GX 13764]|uniref:hypothetical protein n=1 Tax=Metabacillus kandeliae TaxID=2900151 RepID=UPI001E3BE263|nr:hypothetical protein [Metabacillus kandeliae]MCD7033604.1 hypothetical protein [Metabacillus kandeliae]